MSAWKCRLVVLTSLFATTWLPLHAAAPLWRHIQTPDFVIYSDAAPSDVTEFAVKFSAYHYAFRTLFAAPGHALPPTTVLLFRRSKEFAAHTPKVQNRKTTLVNYSVDVDGTALLALAVSRDPDEAISRTFEFETIWALRRMGYYLPVWLAQGAGEVLGTVEVSAGKCLIGRESGPYAEQFATNRDTIPWPRFFEIGESSPEYAGKLATGTFHSQAWALMHWVLLKDDQTRERFQALAASLKNMAAIDAVQAVMGEPSDHFRTAIERHLRHFRAPRLLAFDDAAVRASLKITPAAEAEVLAQTSNLLAAAGRIDECNAQLERARKLAPDRPEVKEAWARRAIRENQPDEATRLYREAITAGSKNSAAYLNSATARLDASAIGNSDREGGGGPETLIALREIRHALELNPGSSEAYRLLGRTFWLLPELAGSYVDELSAGITAGEAGSRVRYYRALLYFRLGKTDESFADLQQIIDNAEVSVTDRNRAKERLAFEHYAIDRKKVNQLVLEKRHDEARRIIELAISRGLDADSTERYSVLRSWLEEDAAWTNLVKLGESARWPDLRKAAHAFVDTFPKSGRVAAARQLESEAKRMEQPSAK